MKYKFYHPLRVRYVETDPQQHVLFSHYLNYFDIGLTEYTRAIGYFYPEMIASGVDMFYVEASCHYKGPARFGIVADYKEVLPTLTAKLKELKSA